MRSISFVRLIALFINCSFLFLACSQAPNSVSQEETSTSDTTFAELERMLPSDSGDFVKLSASLNRDQYQPAGDDATRYLYVEVSTKKYESKQERKPLNISLVIDKSGSMEGDKMTFVKEAAAFVVQHLKATDFISLISYSDDVEVTWQAAELKDKNTLRAKIDGIFSQGATNLSGGMLQGYNEVKTFYSEQYTNRVLLLTDGLANEGIVEPEALCNISRSKNLEHNTTLSTFGVGADFNEDLLQQMAELGSGNYYFIESPEEIPAIFKEELEGLLSVVAQNSSLIIDLPEGVKLEQVFGYEYEQNGQQVQIAFKDLVSEEQKGVLLKLKVDGAASNNLEFSSTLTYTDAVSDYENKKLLIHTSLEPTNDLASLRESTNASVEQWVTFYESNFKLAEAVRLAEENNVDAAQEVLMENTFYMNSRSSTYGESKAVQKMIDANSKYDSTLASPNFSSGVGVGTKSVKKEIYELKKQKKIK